MNLYFRFSLVPPYEVEIRGEGLVIPKASHIVALWDLSRLLEKKPVLCGPREVDLGHPRPCIRQINLLCRSALKAPWTSSVTSFEANFVFLLPLHHAAHKRRDQQRIYLVELRIVADL